MTRAYLLGVRAFCAGCVVAAVPLVGAAVDRGRAIDAHRPDPNTVVVGLRGQPMVLGGWTLPEWWGHELGRRVGWAPWGLEMMQRVGAERCSWSPLQRDYDQWCWPRIERLREDNER